MNEPSTATVANLFPELNAEQLKEAEANLEQYLTMVTRIYQRISTDEQALASLRKDLACLTG